MTFQLPSLALATAYDTAPPAPLRLPGEIPRAHYPVLALADGIGGGSDGSIRLASRALLGVRVETDVAWVKVSLTLAVDGRTRGLRAAAGLYDDLPHLHAVAVHAAQAGEDGEPLSVALFAPRGPGELIELVEAVLPVRHGLVVFGLRPVDPGHQLVVEESLLGIRVDGVRVEEWDPEQTGVTFTTGRPRTYNAPLPEWSELIAVSPLRPSGGTGVKGRIRMVAVSQQGTDTLEPGLPVRYRVVDADGGVLQEQEAIRRNGAVIMPIRLLDRPAFVRVTLPAPPTGEDGEAGEWRVRFVAT